MTELPDTWSSSWAWSLPLIVFTVVGHSFGLLLITGQATATLTRMARGFRLTFGVTMSAVVLLVILLHGLEGEAWAGAYLWLGALPDLKSATLYSLEAMTTYGHTNVELAAHWRLMGALEALNGMILFGLTTAFLFDVVQSALASRLTDDNRRL